MLPALNRKKRLAPCVECVFGRLLKFKAGRKFSLNDLSERNLKTQLYFYG